MLSPPPPPPQSSDVEESDLEPLSPLSDESGDSISVEDLLEELYTPVHPGEEKKDRAFWERYFQQIRESEGFDIKDYPGSCPLTTVFPMRHYVKRPDNVEMLKGYAAKALEQYNEQSGTQYEVNEILKVNGAGCKDCNRLIDVINYSRARLPIRKVRTYSDT